MWDGLRQKTISRYCPFNVDIREKYRFCRICLCHFKGLHVYGETWDHKVRCRPFGQAKSALYMSDRLVRKRHNAGGGGTGSPWLCTAVSMELAHCNFDDLNPYI
jgi:hypothetical protein